MLFVIGKSFDFTNYRPKKVVQVVLTLTRSIATTDYDQYCLKLTKEKDYENYLIGLLYAKEYRALFFAVRAFNIEVSTAI